MGRPDLEVRRDGGKMCMTILIRKIRLIRMIEGVIEFVGDII